MNLFLPCHMDMTHWLEIVGAVYQATAFTDPENEAVIQDSINKLVQGKTLIVIAHRLSTITGAEKILVMDRGSITEQGTHQELLHSSALYSGLWKSHISAKDTGEEVFV